MIKAWLVRNFAFAIFLSLFFSLAIAQVPLPYVPPELYQERRRLQEDRITFCIWEVSPTSNLDRDVAQAIGSILLLEVELYVYESRVPLLEDNFWEAIFIHLAEHCDALMGFNIVPEGYPDWLIPSRPYYNGPHVLVVTNENYSRLGDIPNSEIVGSSVYSLADYRFQQYLQSLPQEQRWRRFPYTSEELMLDHLERGVISGAIVWAPSLHEFTDGDPATRGFRTIPLNPMPAVSTPVGLILREYNTLLRSQLDDAITALIEDGVIADLIEQHGLLSGEPSIR